ncbi:MAG: pilus assembly protein PilM, partial [Armatimonadetes bacterium]|nr:pilus assembly protein PilM [Armatimonadota bacterium]
MGRWRRRGPGGPPLLGLDIGQHSIKLAHLDLTGVRPALVGLAAARTPLGLFDQHGALASRDALSDCVTQLAAELSLRQGDLACALDVPPAELIPLSLSAEVDDPQAAVEAALATRLPYPPGEAAIYWQELPTEPEAALRRVMVSVAPRGLVEAVSSALARTRFDPLVMDLAPLAACHALIGCGEPWLRTATVLLLDVGATHITGTLVVAGEVTAVRAAASGSEDVTLAVADALAADLAVAERYQREVLDLAPDEAEGDEPDSTRAVRLAVEERLAGLPALADELLALAPETNPPETILLYGGGARLRGLDDYLTARLGLTARVAAPLATLEVSGELPPGLPGDAARYVTALGLA